MRKIVFGLSVVLAACLVSGILIGVHMVRRSFPQTRGTAEAAGITSAVQVYRDDYGVPHLFAASEYDLYFAAGFVHAQERLWQMELMRRAGNGQLSEILGEPALPIDRMFRTLGLRQHAARLMQMLDGPTRAALESYAAGVNAFIASSKGRLPLEFDMLNTEPAPWKVEHSLLISRLMAWELNYSRWVDLLEMELINRLGEERAREVFPYWPAGAPTIVPRSPRAKKGAAALRTLTDADAAFRSLVGGPGFGSGSNAWVVSGSKSTTGKPILANDPHLILMTPGRWFEMHLSAPGIDVEGATVPGIPFVVIGRNERIAWGVTNAMLDDDDFYLEEVDSVARPTRYRFRNEWRAVSERTDTILVKGALPVLLTVYGTHRGPIVNRMEPGAQFATSLISMRWVGHEMTDETGAFYWINRSAGWNDFTAALRRFGTPAQNFVYADVDGNIGYYTGGRIPVRPPKPYLLPAAGSTDEADWKGFIPFEANPHVLNPPAGFIVTANNRIVDESYPYHLSNHYEPPWRAVRLNEVLSEQMRFSPEEIRRLQTDVYSVHAREVVPILLAAFDSVEVTDGDTRTALSYLRNWTFEMRTEDVSPTIFQASIDRIVDNTFRDEMGDQLFALYDTLASVPLTVITGMLRTGTSEWFDDIRTPERETCNIIIRRSVTEALQDLRRRLGGEVKEWRWGTVHEVRFSHVFGASPLLARIFNVGPFPVGGAHSTINVSQYFLSQPFLGAVGPSTRQVFDLSDRNNTRAVTPPGQSGHPFFRHYDDQVALWLNGASRTVPMDLPIIERVCPDLLTLVPHP